MLFKTIRKHHICVLWASRLKISRLFAHGTLWLAFHDAVFSLYTHWRLFYQTPNWKVYIIGRLSFYVANSRIHVKNGHKKTTNSKFTVYLEVSTAFYIPFFCKGWSSVLFPNIGIFGKHMGIFGQTPSGTYLNFDTVLGSLLWCPKIALALFFSSKVVYVSWVTQSGSVKIWITIWTDTLKDTRVGCDTSPLNINLRVLLSSYRPDESFLVSEFPTSILLKKHCPVSGCVCVLDDTPCYDLNKDLDAQAKFNDEAQKVRCPLNAEVSCFWNFIASFSHLISSK